MTITIGNAVLSWSKLTVAVARTAKIICNPPIRAEALPAFLLKGARQRAEQFGTMNPNKLTIKKIIIRIIVKLKFK